MWESGDHHSIAHKDSNSKPDTNAADSSFRPQLSRVWAQLCILCGDRAADAFLESNVLGILVRSYSMDAKLEAPAC